MRVLITMICLASVCLCQSVEDGWRGITPLVTTRAEVEAKLGKPEIDKNGYHSFKTEEAYVRVNYSTPPCLPNQYNRGKYNVPEETVLRYHVSFNNAFLKPVKIEFDKTTHFRDVGHTNSILYYDGKSGVIISAEEMQDKEYITGLDYQPSKSMAEKLKCSKDPRCD